MRLNEVGEMVHARWQRLPFHFPNLQLDAFVVMPNHIHGILGLTDLLGRGAALAPGRGAALDQDSAISTDHLCSNATPTPHRSSEPGVAFGQNALDSPQDGLLNAAPLPAYADGLSGPGVAFGQNALDSPQDGLPNAAPLPAYADGLSGPDVAFGQNALDSPQDGLLNAAPLPPRLVAGSVGAIVLNFKSVTTRSCNRMKRSSGIPIWQRNYYEHIVRNEESLQRIRQYIHHNPLLWQQDQLHPNNPSKW